MHSFDFDPDSVNDIREESGRVDLTVMNIIGFDASALGNHEFDAGTAQVRTIIGPDIRDINGDTVLDNARWLGAQFPYLSADLDFSGDPNLSGLFTPDILPNTGYQSSTDGTITQADLPAIAAGKKIAPATIIEEGGELIGVVGATTQLLASISSPGNVTVIDPDGVPGNDMVELASILQPVIDQMLAMGINKIVLVSHLQQISLEQELANYLHGVDVDSTATALAALALYEACGDDAPDPLQLAARIHAGDGLIERILEPPDDEARDVRDHSARHEPEDDCAEHLQGEVGDEQSSGLSDGGTHGMSTLLPARHRAGLVRESPPWGGNDSRWLMLVRPEPPVHRSSSGHASRAAAVEGQRAASPAR